jgi:hypothetical protein
MREVEALIQRIGHEQVACVLVTHDAAQAARLAERCWFWKAAASCASVLAAGASTKGSISRAIATRTGAGCGSGAHRLKSSFLLDTPGIHLEKDLAIAMVRGLAQIVAVGSILLLLLKAPSWTNIFL